MQIEQLPSDHDRNVQLGQRLIQRSVRCRYQPVLQRYRTNRDLPRLHVVQKLVRIVIGQNCALRRGFRGLAGHRLLSSSHAGQWYAFGGS